MQEIKSISISSVVKSLLYTLGIFYAGAGLVFYVVSLVFSFIDNSFSILDAFASLIALAVLVGISLLLMILFSVVLVWLYNKIAPRAGGITVEIEEK